MEEHIESVGADSEGIVKVNVRVLLYAFLFVVVALCAAVAAALHWEPVGLQAARVLAGRCAPKIKKANYPNLQRYPKATYILFIL